MTLTAYFWIKKAPHPLMTNVATADRNIRKKSILVGSCSLPLRMYAAPYSLAGFMSARIKPPRRRVTLAKKGAVRADKAYRLNRGISSENTYRQMLANTPKAGRRMPSMHRV